MKIEVADFGAILSFVSVGFEEEKRVGLTLSYADCPIKKSILDTQLVGAVNNHPIIKLRSKEEKYRYYLGLDKDTQIVFQAEEKMRIGKVLGFDIKTGTILFTMHCGMTLAPGDTLTVDLPEKLISFE